MKLGTRELLFCVVMLGLLAGSYFLGFARQAERRLAKQGQIETRQKALYDLQQATEGIGDVKEKIGELQKATASLESRLPQAKEIDKILREVSQLAEVHNLTTKAVRTLATQRLNGYSEQPIEMGLSGDFTGFYQFLLQLEKLARLNRVTRMGLTKITDRDGEMQAQVTLSIFYAPDSETESGAVAAGR
jgi:type IV pilus assembly protein PilO